MGERIAVFGDSISTFDGCVPAANKVYYEGELCDRNGVMRPADTWWMQVIEALDGQLWANGAYSGCLVAGDAFPAASTPERAAQVLGADGAPPDAVLVYVGINDYGEGTPLPTFEQAYAAMLANLRTAAPEAELRCATLLPGRSAEHDVEHFRAKYKGESLKRTMQPSAPPLRTRARARAWSTSRRAASPSTRWTAPTPPSAACSS